MVRLRSVSRTVVREGRILPDAKSEGWWQRSYVVRRYPGYPLDSPGSERRGRSRHARSHSERHRREAGWRLRRRASTNTQSRRRLLSAPAPPCRETETRATPYAEPLLVAVKRAAGEVRP